MFQRLFFLVDLLRVYRGERIGALEIICLCKFSTRAALVARLGSLPTALSLSKA